MRMNLKIAIAEPAELMRIGLGTILKRFSGFQIQLVELAQGSAWKDSLRLHHPDILIVNPIIPGYQDLQQIKEETGCETMKCIALVAAPIEATQLQHYDEQIHVYDSSQTIRYKLESLFHEEEDEEYKENEDGNQLSSREKEIVICVVKGMTNREIADRLFLSTHTVITDPDTVVKMQKLLAALEDNDDVNNVWHSWEMPEEEDED